MPTNAILLGAPNLFADAVVQGGGWTIGRPLASVLTDQPSDFARAGSARKRDAWFYFTLAALEDVGLLAVSQHNLQKGVGKVRWRRFASDPRGVIDAIFTGEQVLPSGWTLTRASVATYFDRFGVLQTAAADVARPLWINGVREGLLIETNVSNVLLWCRDVTNAAWTRSFVTAAKTVTGIDGVGNSACVLTASNANATATQAISAGTTGVFSIYVRRRTGSGVVQLSINGFTSSTAIVPTATWQRFQIAGTSGASVGIRMVTAGDEIEVDFAQFEVTPAVLPSTPIYTQGSPAARAPDAIQAPVSAASFAGGAVLLDGYMLVRPAATQPLAGLDAGNANNRCGFDVTSGGVVQAGVTSGAVAQVSGVASAAVSGGQGFVATMSWALNDVRASFDGGAVQTDSTATMPVGTPSRVTLTAGACWAVRRLKVFGAAQTNASLIALAGVEQEVAAAYDSGEVDAWAPAWVTAAAAREQERTPGLAVHFLPSAQQGLYWRLDLVDPTNPAPLELARVIASPARQPAVNMSFGAGVGYEARDLIEEAESGAEFGARRRARRVVRFGLGHIVEAEAFDLHFNLQADIGSWGEVLFCWNPNDTTQFHRRTFVGRLRKLNLLETPSYALFGTAYEISERM
jgi:hypothetical protein